MSNCFVVNSLIFFLFSFHRHSPCPVRRPANPYKDSKPPNSRLSAAVRAQQRNSPRGANGDRSKPPKGKEKKESKETKDAGGKAKDDKVNMNLPSFIPFHFYCCLFSIHMLLVYLEPCPACHSSFSSGTEHMYSTFRDGVFVLLFRTKQKARRKKWKSLTGLVSTKTLWKLWREILYLRIQTLNGMFLPLLAWFPYKRH